MLFSGRFLTPLRRKERDSDPATLVVSSRERGVTPPWGWGVKHSLSEKGL